MTPKLSTSGEPVMFVAIATAALGWVVTFLVTHGVITATHASVLVQSIGPAIVSAVAIGLGVLVRKYVAPAWKVIDSEAAKVGIDLTTDADVVKFLADLGLDPQGDPVTPPAVTEAPPVPA